MIAHKTEEETKTISFRYLIDTFLVQPEEIAFICVSRDEKKHNIILRLKGQPDLVLVYCHKKKRVVEEKFREVMNNLFPEEEKTNE